MSEISPLHQYIDELLTEQREQIIAEQGVKASSSNRYSPLGIDVGFQTLKIKQRNKNHAVNDRIGVEALAFGANATPACVIAKIEQPYTGCLSDEPNIPRPVTYNSPQDVKHRNELSIPGTALVAKPGQLKLLQIDVCEVSFGIEWEHVEDVAEIKHENMLNKGTSSTIVGDLNWQDTRKTVLHLAHIVLPMRWQALQRKVQTPAYAVILRGLHIAIGCDHVHQWFIMNNSDICFSDTPPLYPFLRGVVQKWPGAMLNIDALSKMFAGDGAH